MSSNSQGYTSKPSIGRGTHLTSLPKERISDVMSTALNRLNITNDHDEMIETIDDLKKVLTELDRKEKTMRVIETLAMSSQDQCIADLRKEMFTTVKLIHSDKIKAAVDNLCGESSDGDHLVYSGTTGSGHWGVSAVDSTITLSTMDNDYELVDMVHKKQNLYQRIKKAIKND